LARAWNLHREWAAAPERTRAVPYAPYWERGIDEAALDITDRAEYRDGGILTKAAYDGEVKPKLDELFGQRGLSSDLPAACFDCQRQRVCGTLKSLRVETQHDSAYPADFAGCAERATGEPIACPVCGSTRVSIHIINRYKRQHYYQVSCSNCDWGRPVPFSYGFAEGETTNEKRATQRTALRQLDELCHDLLEQAGYYARGDAWVGNLGSVVQQVRGAMSKDEAE
jgi:hypothetical protein